MTEFPAGFFDRADESPDAEFYEVDRFVTHIDGEAIEAVGALYRELQIDGDVLDLCASWVSHFDPTPEHLVLVGMNDRELAANPSASETMVLDLNADPVLPFPDESFDAVTCCVSIDYLIRPIELFGEVARVLRPGAPFVVTFSNRCFPTKAIRGWLGADDRGRCTIVAVYFAAVRTFGEPTVQLRNPGAVGDPLFAVWARKLPGGVAIRPATAADQAIISEMQYAALFVPPGAPPFPRSIIDEPQLHRYHADFATRPGDVGRIAERADGTPVGAAWVRLVDGFGFVDDQTPELGVAVIADDRGRGIGTALLESLLAVVPRCSLSVDERNPAMRLYERLGFARVRVDGEFSAVMLRAGGNGAAA